MKSVLKRSFSTSKATRSAKRIRPFLHLKVGNEHHYLNKRTIPRVRAIQKYTLWGDTPLEVHIDTWPKTYTLPFDEKEDAEKFLKKLGIKL